MPRYARAHIICEMRHASHPRNLKTLRHATKRVVSYRMNVPMTSPRALRLCLVMHSTRSDNLDLGAPTVSQAAILRDSARVMGRPIDITLLDRKDTRPPCVRSPAIRIVDLDGSLLKDLRSFFATVRRTDWVIDIGAGDRFADSHGAGRLIRLFVMKNLAHLARTPLVVAPQTIGAFTESWSKRLALWSLRMSAMMAKRDERPMATLHNLGYRGAFVEASNVALRLPLTGPTAKNSGPPRVTINLSDLLKAGEDTGKNELGAVLDCPAQLRRLVTRFQSLAPRGILWPMSSCPRAA